MSAAAMGWREALRLVDENRRFLVITHHYPDGDALGSLLGLTRHLKHLGKQVKAVMENPIPRVFQFLDSAQEIEQYDPNRFDWSWPQVVFILDTREQKRLGSIGDALPWDSMKTVCIDHHQLSGALPSTVDILDPNASSVGEMIADMIRTSGESLEKDVAIALYVAVMTDTGGFRFSNTGPETFRVAASLVEQGASPQDLYEQVYEKNAWSRLKLFGEMLQRAAMKADGRIVYSVLPSQSFDHCGAVPDEIEGFVEYLRTAETAWMALLFREVDGKVKVSLRSHGKVDVARFASAFGGGGHANAAGFVASPPLERVVEETIREAERFIDPMVSREQAVPEQRVQ